MKKLLFLFILMLSPMLASAQAVSTQEYYPEGAKWTEIRLDTLKYDSWYSKVGDEWVPNFETIEYYVKGEYVEKKWDDDLNTFKKVYTNGPEWTDSLTLLLWEGSFNGDDKCVLATIPPVTEFDGSSYLLFPGNAYQFDWSIGTIVEFKDITSSNATAIFPPGTFDFGTIDEIKEGDFGGASSLSYADVNGVRIIQGIGVTTWNDGECLFGPVEPYQARTFFQEESEEDRHYRSMLVHFERNGEVLYDVWPEKEVAYHPFLKEGKTWNCMLQYGPDYKTEYYKNVIRGDSIVNGITYFKMYRETDTVTELDFYALWREDKGKVYTYVPYEGKERLMYDFSAQPGSEMVCEGGKVQVKTVTKVTVGEQSFNCLSILISDNDIVNWVEGIGSLYGPDYPLGQMLTNGERTELLSCYEDGRLIFETSDFNKVVNPLYRPFVEDGKVWKVGGKDSGNPVTFVAYYYFDGDTIIGGKTCKQMMCQRYFNPDCPNSSYYDYWAQLPPLSKVGAWYEEDKKVYVCREGTQGMKMLYDFSLEANDTLILNLYQPDYTVGPKQTGGLKGFKGVYRDIMLCGQDIYITTWLEGVGGIDGPLRNVYPETESDPQFLMACTVGDEVIFLNDEYEDGATPEGLGIFKKRFDFTHTTKLQPKTPRRSDEEQSLYGEYNSKLLGINLDPLDDTYQVHIFNESGLAVYEKTVNAGTIVGLSIDISDYAKGCYTVTVENSNELFTGEFETETTGIEETIYNKVEAKTDIYNLQGQRLSSPQKGLNIVNGKKVYVK